METEALPEINFFWVYNAEYDWYDCLVNGQDIGHVTHVHAWEARLNLCNGEYSEPDDGRLWSANSPEEAMAQAEEWFKKVLLDFVKQFRKLNLL